MYLAPTKETISLFYAPAPKPDCSMRKRIALTGSDGLTG